MPRPGGNPDVSKNDLPAHHNEPTRESLLVEPKYAINRFLHFSLAVANLPPGLHNHALRCIGAYIDPTSILQQEFSNEICSESYPGRAGIVWRRGVSLKSIDQN